MILPYCIFEKLIRTKQKWHLFSRYKSAVAKYSNNVARINFLSECLKNDIIPKFLKFRVPENGCFEPTIVHNFQKKLLRSELTKARLARNQTEEKLSCARQGVSSAFSDKLLVSVSFYIRQSLKLNFELLRNKHRAKLKKLAVDQDKPLAERSDNVVVLADVKPPNYVLDVLSRGPKHPVLDKFNEMSFLADMDRLMCQVKHSPQNTSGTINNLNALSVSYIRKASTQRPDRSFLKTCKFLKEYDLMAVPFDKGCGFCIMTKQQYSDKLNDVTTGEQFSEVTDISGKKHLLQRTEDAFNKKLEYLKKHGQLGSSVYNKLRSSGSQPARLYGLAKVHKDGIPLRPVLSLPGSCYANINQFISDFSVNLPGASIETSTMKVKHLLETVVLSDDEEIVSFDVKSLYTNVPIDEAIDFALAKLYASEHRPKMPQNTFHELMKLAVKNVKFMVDGKWFVQKDGVAMGASLSVILANLWLKNFENRLKCDQGTMAKHANCVCGICNKKVTYRGYSIQCDSCDLWFHRKCSSLSLNEFRALSEEDPWCCNICLNHKSGCKLFARYVDDIIRTVRSTEVDSLLGYFNQMHVNLKFTIERSLNHEIPFLDMVVSQSGNRL